MNRRSFFRNLVLGIAVVPAALKAIGNKRTYAFAPTDYMKVAPFDMEPGTIYFIPGVNGNYASAPDWPAAEIKGDIQIVMKPARSC